MNCNSHLFQHLPAETLLALTRRQLFAHGRNVLGTAALSSLFSEQLTRAFAADDKPALPHFPPKAKNVIYLHMVGGPSQMDLYDYKPEMVAMYDKDLPDSIRNGQRLTGMTSGQTRFPVAPSKYKFSQAGQCGLWMNTELLPFTAKSVDDMAFVRSMYTEAINHEPAITAMQTGSQISGRPCIGSWVSYGLGSVNQNLPTFVVLVAKPTKNDQPQAISGKLWSSGFLPGEHAGVSFRSAGDPILYINNPAGVSPALRRRQLDGLNALNEMAFQSVGDPETHTRIQQYEMAFRMQASVPELTTDCYAVKAGEEAFEELLEFVRSKNLAAAESLESRKEGILAFHRLNVPSTLNVTFLSTNHIENVMRNSQGMIGKVCRWNAKTDQLARWMGVALLRSQEGFRRVKGHNELGRLAAALERSGCAESSLRSSSAPPDLSSAEEKCELARANESSYQMPISQPAEILTI